MGEEGELQNPGNQGGGNDSGSNRFASVQFLQRRSNDQEEQHVVEEMRQIGVSEDMSEKADIGEGIEQGGTVDREDSRCRCSGCEKTEDKGEQGNEKEPENDRGVELQFFHDRFPPG